MLEGCLEKGNEMHTKNVPTVVSYYTMFVKSTGNLLMSLGLVMMHPVIQLSQTDTLLTIQLSMDLWQSEVLMDYHDN